MIRAGQKLAIYVPEKSKAKYEASESKTETAGSAIAAISAETSGDFYSYTVKRGDTPGEIAHQFGMNPEDVMSLNGISSEKGLQIGQKLKVRKKI